MVTRQVPQVRELDARDLRAMLYRHHVGRLAFAWGGRLDVRPIHYVYSGGRLYGRTSHGAKFAELEALPAPVAFEIDEVESMSRWKSVIVRGSFHVLYPEGKDQPEWEHAVELLRGLVHDTFLDDDPFPQRSVVFRIVAEEMSGRAME